MQEKKVIEAVSEHNLSEALPLIRKYQEFYKAADISDTKNRAFFSRFGESSTEGCLFIYRDENNNAVAFATIYFSYSSTIAEKVAVLNDLYTEPGHRGKSIGRQLLEHCRQYAALNKACRLQWVTAPDNTQAQALYDSIGASKSHWCFYTLNAWKKAP